MYLLWYLQSFPSTLIATNTKIFFLKHFQFYSRKSNKLSFILKNQLPINYVSISYSMYSNKCIAICVFNTALTGRFVEFIIIIIIEKSAFKKFWKFLNFFRCSRGWKSKIWLLEALCNLVVSVWAKFEECAAKM